MSNFKINSLTLSSVMKKTSSLRLYLLSWGLLFASISYAQNNISYDSLMPLEPYNFVLGTNSIGGKYQFTTENKLIEQAKHVRAMGSNIIKITLGKNSPKTYGISEHQDTPTTLALFTSHPEYKAVFDMDFKYLFTWVHTLTGIDWRKGINETNEKVLYDEMFNFASYLLNEYDRSGKTFFIGNWEGDWLLHPNYNRNMTPPQEDIDNMTKWFQIRQKAIDDAKRMSKATNVFLYHYIEVNLVLKGINGNACIAKSILPNVNVDLVSYSSYEAIKNKTYTEKKDALNAVFNYLEEQLKPKPSLPFTRRVFIGEYGYQANANKPETFQKQFDETKQIMQVAFELNLPFALHWQMYNNEYEKGQSKQMSLINKEGVKTRLYYVHQAFYSKMNAFVMEERKRSGSYPTSEKFRQKAIEVLETL